MIQIMMIIMIMIIIMIILIIVVIVMIILTNESARVAIRAARWDPTAAARKRET